VYDLLFKKILNIKQAFISERDLIEINKLRNDAKERYLRQYSRTAQRREMFNAVMAPATIAGGAASGGAMVVADADGVAEGYGEEDEDDEITDDNAPFIKRC